MNPGRLLTHFDRISEAPDAIPRLRRFVLDLAVRGKLVEQDPRDEPAVELLKRIQAEKAQLIKGGKVREQESLRTVTDLELPFAIPDSWVWISLESLAEKITDGEHLSPKKTTAGMPLLTATHVTSQGVTLNNSQFVSIEDGHKSRQRCDPRRGDILICSRGTIGRCAVVNTDEIFCLMGSVILVRFPKEISSAYFCYFLSTDRAQMQMRGMSGATAVRALYLKDIRLSPVALPPIAEQHRIVAKVDELMALCDRLEAAQTERESRRDRLAVAVHASLSNSSFPTPHSTFFINHLPHLTARREHIEQLRQTILNLAVRGKLVPQDLNDEPASELLKGIQAEKARLVREGETTEQKQLDLNGDADEPFDIPMAWLWVCLGDIAFGFRYGTSVKCSYEPTGQPVLRIPNIDNGRINLDDLKLGPLTPREAEDLRLQLGDILMVRSNGSLNLVGRPALVEAHAVVFCYAGYLVRVRSSIRHLDARYLLLALNTVHVRDQIEIPIRTTVGLKNVNIKKGVGNVSCQSPERGGAKPGVAGH